MISKDVEPSDEIPPKYDAELKDVVSSRGQNFKMPRSSQDNPTSNHYQPHPFHLPNPVNSPFLNLQE
jgi:hypothetical protein